MSKRDLCEEFSAATRGLSYLQRNDIMREALGWLLAELQESPAENQEALMEYVRQRAKDMRGDAEAQTKIDFDNFCKLARPLHVRLRGDDTWYRVFAINFKKGMLGVEVGSKIEIGDVESFERLRDNDGIEHDPKTLLVDKGVGRE